MAEHAYDEFGLAASRPEASVRSFGTPIRSEVTSESWDDLEGYPEYDFGPLRVRVPAEAEMRMGDPDALYSDAVFFVFPDGKVRLSVLAAPRGGRLWPERAGEIARAQANLGADVRTFTGEWGEELQITDDGETNWVIGVDGPRWMLLGRSTSPIGADSNLSHTMRDMIRSGVVFRGDEPLPVRTPLPLREPGTFDAETPVEDRVDGPYAGVVTLIFPKVEAPVAADPVDRQQGTHLDEAHDVTDGTVAAPGSRHSLNPALPAVAATANPNWAVAARSASAAETTDVHSDFGSAFAEPLVEEPAPGEQESIEQESVEPIREARVQHDGDDELARRRQAVDIAVPASRKHAGLFPAAALVAAIAVVGLAGLMFALRGSDQGVAEPAIASPRQVNEQLTPQQAYPDDAYPATPKVPKVVPQVPAPKAAPPLAAGPALRGGAPVPGVSGAKTVAPRTAAPVRSNPVPANGAARPLGSTDVVAHTPATGRSRSTSAPPAVEPSRPGRGRQSAAGSDDSDDSYDQRRGSGSRSHRGGGGGEDDGPLGALSNDVLGAVPGLG